MTTSLAGGLLLPYKGMLLAEASRLTEKSVNRMHALLPFKGLFTFILSLLSKSIIFTAIFALFLQVLLNNIYCQPILFKNPLIAISFSEPPA
jgi:hypothetical protein